LSSENLEALRIWNQITILGADVVFPLVDLQLTPLDARILLDKFTEFKQYQNWVEHQKIEAEKRKAKKPRGR